MAPNTCDGTYCCGAGDAVVLVLVLLSVAVVLLALLLRLGRAVRRHF